MELMNIVKNENFEPMNYKISGIYKFYSTITNACFVSIRESNNEEIMKKYDNSCIVVSGYGSTTKSKNMLCM